MACLRSSLTRPARALALALALGSGLGAGCLIVETEPASGCTLPRECPIDPDLTIEACSDGWAFSDGSSTTDERTALETCYCTRVDAACSDGRTATLCPPAPSDHVGIGVDGQDTTFFDDGLQRSFEDGWAECFGFNDCRFGPQIDCQPARWYLICDAADGEHYIGWDGTEMPSEDSAQRYCAGQSLEEALEFCQASTPCADLPQMDCDASSACAWQGGACQDDAFDTCDSAHSAQTACDDDPACSWQ